MANRDQLVKRFVARNPKVDKTVVYGDKFGDIGGSAGDRIKRGGSGVTPKRSKPGSGGHSPEYRRRAKRSGWVEYPGGRLAPDDGSGRGRAL